MDTGNSMGKICAHCLLMPRSLCSRYAGNVSAAGWRGDLNDSTGDMYSNVDGRYYERGGHRINNT
jgi:hypothetical protein